MASHAEQLREAQRQFERAPDDDDLLDGEVDAWDAEAVQGFMCDDMGDFVHSDLLHAFAVYVGDLSDRFTDAKFLRLMREMRLKVLSAIDAHNEEIAQADRLKRMECSEGIGE